MATRRKKAHHKKGHSKGKRRVGAKKELENSLLKGLGVIGGAIGAAFVINAGKTAVPSLPMWAAPAATAVVGGGVAHFGGKSSPIVEGLGDGMLGVGALMTANETFLKVPGVSGMAF